MPNSVDNLLPESDPPQPTMLRVPAPNDLPFRAQRPPMSASRLNEQANQQVSLSHGFAKSITTAYHWWVALCAYG